MRYHQLTEAATVIKMGKSTIEFPSDDYLPDLNHIKMAAVTQKRFDDLKAVLARHGMKFEWTLYTASRKSPMWIMGVGPKDAPTFLWYKYEPNKHTSAAGTNSVYTPAGKIDTDDFLYRRTHEEQDALIKGDFKMNTFDEFKKGDYVFANWGGNDILGEVVGRKKVKLDIYLLVLPASFQNQRRADNSHEFIAQIPAARCRHATEAEVHSAYNTEKSIVDAYNERKAKDPGAMPGSSLADGASLSNMGITTLKGCPEITDTLYLNGNHLRDLKGGPRRAGRLDVSKNYLVTLEGAPEVVEGDFLCQMNKLTSLEHGPQAVGGSYNFSENHVTNLKGMPDKLVQGFTGSKNELTSLEGAPKSIKGGVWLTYNKLESLHNIHKHMPEIHGNLQLHNNPIKSHVLGLVMIKGLKLVTLDNNRVAEIVNKYLGQGREAIMACQAELIEAGFDDYAQL